MKKDQKRICKYCGKELENSTVSYVTEEGSYEAFPAHEECFLKKFPNGKVNNV